MFKNTTRRGLALGAAISLVVTGLAAVPAQAAGEVVLVPSAGTTYNTFVTEIFTLQASLAPGQVPQTAAQLKYKIDKPAGTTVSFGVSTSAAVDASTLLNAASTSVVVAAAGADATTQNFVRVAATGSSSVSPSIDVTVTAFIDSNNNGVLDAGEFNTVRVVSFKRYSDVASVVALTQPLQGDTSLKGTATLTGINTDQVQGTTTFVASIAGAATGSATLANGVYSTAVAALAASTTVSAVVQFRSNQIGAASATLTVTPASVKAVTASAVTGANAKDGLVRVNSAFAVTGTVLNGTTNTASGVAAAAVTAKMTTSATLTSTQSITVNGTTYTSSAALADASLALTSDASGNVTVNVASAGLTASDKISFFFSSENVNANVFEVTQTAAVYEAEAAGTGFLTVAPSGAFSVEYTVADQWGVVAPAGHRIVASYDGTTRYVNLNAGKATVAFTATSSATTISVINDDVEAQNSTTLNWASLAGAVTSSAVVVKTTTVAAKFDAAPTHSATASISRVVTASPGLNNHVTISGTVNHAGDSVTIAGAGVKFSSDGKAVSVGTITVNADGAGHFTVSAYVHTAGTANLVYTVGAATATTSLTVDAAAANEGKEISVEVVSGETAAAGSTIRAKVLLTDEYGNPVAVTNGTGSNPSFGVAISGPGFVGNLPTSTGANGESAEFSILLGSGDTTGTVTITATYDADGTGTTAAPLTVVKTVTIGAVAPVSDQRITVGSFKGFVAIYTLNYTGQKLSAKVAGRWLVQENLTRFQRVVRNTGAAIPIRVELYIDGQFVRTENIVTK